MEYTIEDWLLRYSIIHADRNYLISKIRENIKFSNQIFKYPKVIAIEDEKTGLSIVVKNSYGDLNFKDLPDDICGKWIMLNERQFNYEFNYNNIIGKKVLMPSSMLNNSGREAFRKLMEYDIRKEGLLSI